MKQVLMMFSACLLLIVTGCTKKREHPTDRLASGSTTAPTSVTTGGYTFAGPYTHKNLSVFIIRGKDQAPGKHYLTLQEAIEQNKITVFETGDVNELAAENLSKDEDIFIQAGEIVKGGQQDRTLQNDIVLTANSGKTPLPSFCVEHGRWTQRGSESPSQFNSSTTALSSKDLKIAARVSKDQQQVWDNVAQMQSKLGKNLGGSVTDSASASSLQLALENKRVNQSIEEYAKDLSGIINEYPDAIGFAFVVNGQISSADIYGNHKLFTKLWDKQIRSAITEAISESDAKPSNKTITADDILAFMNAADAATDVDRAKSGSTITTFKEDQSGTYSFSTVDSRTRQTVRKNYLKK